MSLAFFLSGKVIDDKNMKNETNSRNERKILKEKALSLPENAKLLLYEILRGQNIVPKTEVIKNIVSVLIDCGLVEIKNVDYKEIYKAYTAKDIRSMCVKEQPKKTLSKALLIDFFRENYPVEDKKIINDFNESYYFISWPTVFETSRVAIQRAISPYKEINNEHAVSIEIDIKKIGTDEAVKINRLL